MCLQAQGTDDNNDVFGRGRRSQGLSDEDGGVNRVREIDDTSKGLDTTTEAAGD